ncbi:unnamed protein product, partial [Symbiodinium microadriaticum]
FRCSNTTECCAAIIQPSPYCLSPPVGPSPLSLQTTCDSTSKCRERDLRNRLGFFEAKLKEYNDAYALCESSRTGCNDTYACPDKRAKWQEKHAICNSNQTVFEQAYCSLATDVEANWETYSICYTHGKQALVAEEDKQDTLLAGPEAAPGWPPSAAATEKSNPTYAASKLGTVPYPVFGHDLMEAASRDPKSEVFVILGHLENEEWRGLARIECLLSSLARRVYDKEAALEACLKADHTAKANATLTLTFPSRVGNVTAMETCSEKLESP